MSQINRILQGEIEKRMKPNKVILLFGARRVGKTFLIKSIERNFKGTTLFLNGEDNNVRQLLNDCSKANYSSLLEGKELLIIDEAQSVPDIGKKLKLIADEIENIQIIATGSSSFDLLNLAGEPLVGRAQTFHLFPFSQEELMQVENRFEAYENLESKLIYGTYPQTIGISNSEKEEYLLDIVNAYLLKDILAIDGLRSSAKMLDLLRLIAYQSGSLVSNDEIGRQIGLSKNTIEKYLDLLSKVFIIYKLSGFSTNLRKELTKSAKWYFYDNGIRNALINNFSPIGIRQDKGSLWESFMISERIKKKHFHLERGNHYFWRTYDQQEIDLIEVENEEIKAFEFKWGEGKAAIPTAFKKHYPNAVFSVIRKEDYLTF